MFFFFILTVIKYQSFWQTCSLWETIFLWLKTSLSVKKCSSTEIELYYAFFWTQTIFDYYFCDCSSFLNSLQFFRLKLIYISKNVSAYLWLSHTSVLIDSNFFKQQWEWIFKIKIKKLLISQSHSVPNSSMVIVIILILLLNIILFNIILI